MSFEQVLTFVNQLSLGDKLRLMERIIPQIQQAVVVSMPVARRSSWGALSGLGQAPSADEIDEVRGEMWAGFGELEV